MSTYPEFKDALARLNWDTDETVILTSKLSPEQLETIENAMRDAPEPGTYFVAGFDAVCDHGDEIQEGDEIRMTGNGTYAHKVCPDDENEPDTNGPNWGIR